MAAKCRVPAAQTASWEVGKCIQASIKINQYCLPAVPSVIVFSSLEPNHPPNSIPTYFCSFGSPPLPGPSSTTQASLPTQALPRHTRQASITTLLASGALSCELYHDQTTRLIMFNGSVKRAQKHLHPYVSCLITPYFLYSANLLAPGI